ncbi:MAG: FAD-containing oxidoreductase [Bryobacter sp.]
MPPETTHYDALIIGTGQAGPSLAAKLTQAGFRTAIVEKDRPGGTCVNTGCTPTKTLVASAYVAHQMRHAAEYGLVWKGELTVDWAAFQARQRKVVAASRDGLDRWLSHMEKLTFLRGEAKFLSPYQVVINQQKYSADKFYLNVGGRAHVPPIPGLAQVAYYTNQNILDIPDLPRHLVILGGSYIGLEFGQIFRRFGCEVTIIERGARLVEREDPAASEEIRRVLEAEGITILCQESVVAIEKDDAIEKNDAAQSVVLASGQRISGDALLVAIGRRPNTDKLGLPEANVATDPRGYIEVNEELRTSQSHIWALGDCNGRGAFTHTSYNDYEIVAENLLENAGRKVSDRIPCYSLFTDPPLARVGLNRQQAAQRGLAFRVGHRPMTRVSRAVEKGETSGFLEVLVDAHSDAILGATILGVGGDEAIHCIATAMYAGLTARQFRRSVHIHPTVAELLPTVLGELQDPAQA